MLQVVAPSRAAPQAIQTRLVSGDLGGPIVGAIVVLEDSAGREVARTLTDSTGRIEFAPGPGVYRFQVLRIGFARWVSPDVRLAAGTTYSTPVEPAPTPIVLATLKVESRSSCRVEPADSTMTGIVWAEVRKALEATEWTTTHRAYRFRTSWYTRIYDPTDLTVTTESRWEQAGYLSWPFYSLEPESLSTRGYVQRDTTGALIYYAPDVAVLFSDAFLRDHCFRAQRAAEPEEGPTIELAFEPASRRRVSDIAGVLRLDGRSGELRELEYHYINVGRWAEGRSHALLQFERLPTGAWVIRRWFIRAPIPKVARYTFDTLGIGGFSEHGAQVIEVQTAAGQPVARYPLEP